MSCLIVSDTTLSYIVSGVIKYVNQESSLYKELQSCLNIKTDDVNAMPEALFSSLAYMNQCAYNVRYNENFKNTPVYVECSGIELLQLIKHIDCFLYQCSEGDIPEQFPLFSAMERIRDYLCVEHIRHTDAYASRRWG